MLIEITFLLDIIVKNKINMTQWGNIKN